MWVNITVHPEPQPRKRSGFEPVSLSIKLICLGGKIFLGNRLLCTHPPPHLLGPLLQSQGETEPAGDRLRSQLDPSMAQPETFHT